MTTLCEVCGVPGYKGLLLSCKHCNRAAVHQYCLEKVVFDGTSVDWSCYECHPVNLVNKKRCLEDDEHDIQLDSLVPQPENTYPIKKRGRFRDPNDVAEVAAHPVDAKGHHLQSYIYSQPIDVPVWRGIFKAKSNVSVMVSAHLSTKACQRVLEFGRSMPPEVQVMKLPRLEAWPKCWNTSGPTDDSIGLYFFPHSMRQNEESDGLVKEVTESDVVLKVTLGTVELLIFSSILLPEQYHVFQGKYYLWGVLTPKKDNPGTAILVEEQDILASASEKGEIHEHQVMHVESQLPVDSEHEAQKLAMNTAMREGSVSPDDSFSCGKQNPAKAGSSHFVQPRTEHKPCEPCVTDQQEDEQDFTPLPGKNGQNATKPPTESLSSPTTLFGFIAARTARSQQIIQEMAKEGAFLFAVPEEIATNGYTIGNSNAIGVAITPDNGNQHIQERRHPIEFVPVYHDDSDTASETSLELFPVRQEQIGLIHRVDANKEVELNLSLGACGQAPSAFP